MKLWIVSLLFLFPRTEAQIPESPKLQCEYPSLNLGSFNRGTIRDEMAHVVNNTVKSLRALGMSDDKICKSGIYVRARNLYERVVQDSEAATVNATTKAKYSSKESSL